MIATPEVSRAHLTAFMRTPPGFARRGQARQVLALERDDDPDGLVFRRVRDRLAEAERREIEAKLKVLDVEALYDFHFTRVESEKFE